jgi:drug/metabolite transporter (DMT)-like permease
MLIVGAVMCWAMYTVFARPMLARLSPLVVTAWTMVFGALLYVPAAAPQMMTVDWNSVSWRAWVLTLLSAFLALTVSYLIWYTSVQRVGSARTSFYSNVVPVVAMSMAWGLLGEPVGRTKVTGAALILGGVLFTRLAGGRYRPPDPPAEE